MNQLVRVASESVVPAEEQLTSEIGRKILERIRTAMSNATLEKLHPNRIRPMNEQPRTYFNDPRIKNLAQSIKESGQMMPGIVRRIPLDALGRDFELCDGERRLRAVLLGGVAFYRAMVIEIDDEAAQYVVSIISNFNREGHTTLEVVDSVVKMHDRLGLTFREIAAAIGLGPLTVNNMYGLRRLKPEVRDMLDPHLVKGRTLPVQAAIEISRLPVEHQHALALRVLHGAVSARLIRQEILQVAQTHNLPIRSYTKNRSDQRKSIKSRIETIAVASEELKKIVHEDGVEQAMLELPEFNLRQLVSSLETTAKLYVTIYERLSGILARKQGRLISK